MLLCTFLLCIVPRLNIRDFPEERSAHSSPVFKGGGIAIIIGTLLGSFLWIMLHPQIKLPIHLTEALIAILILASFSLLDDIKSQNVWLKLAIQMLSAFLAMHSFGFSLYFTLCLTVISTILINSINFMDGLNGLSSGVMILSGIFLFQTDLTESISLPLSAALLAFLPWNFPKARIFMSDIGSQSCALILCLAAASLLCPSSNHPVNLRTAILLPSLLNAMIFDVFLTLFRRFLNQDSLTKAHNTHLYQLAARSHLMSPVQITFWEWIFSFWGGIIALSAPFYSILPLLLLPQIIWATVILRFWKNFQKTSPGKNLS